MHHDHYLLDDEEEELSQLFKRGQQDFPEEDNIEESEDHSRPQQLNGYQDVDNNNDPLVQRQKSQSVSFVSY